MIDLTKQLNDGRHDRVDPWGWQGIAVHRVWMSDWMLHEEHGVLELMSRFLHDESVYKWVGAPMTTYHFVGDREGHIYQCLPLHEKGGHAVRFNSSYLGVAAVGDFRVEKPTPIQQTNLTRLVADLSLAFGLQPMVRKRVGGELAYSVSGHDELAGGSRDPAKVCPGKWLPMEQLRFEAARMLRDDGRAQLSGDGIVV